MKNFKKSGTFARKGFAARGSAGAKRGAPAFGHRQYEEGERFQAVCNECGATCEVPFRPNGKKPVYCRNCFKGKEDMPVRSSASTYMRPAAPTADFSKQFDLLNAKLDKLLVAIEK